MAKAKKRKKKSNAENLVGLMLFIIILLIIAVGIMVIFREPENQDKAKDYFSDVTGKFTYPTDYEEYVIKYSAEYDIDPRFVFAVINTESHFNPEAVSEVGARGLMQIMPDAFDWIKFRLNDKRNIDFDDMFDPETNIQYGAYMLSYLYEDFGCSYELAAGAYHQGMNAVHSWIDDGTIDPENFGIDENLDDVPSDITKDYIYKVMKAFEKYKDNSQLEEDINNGKYE